MKNLLLILCLIFFVNANSQSLNNYQYVIIPTKFSFQKTPMSYRVNSTTMAYFNQKGFTTYYDNEIPQELNNQRCKAIYVDIIENNSLLSTKLTVNLVDCDKKILMTSKQGVSREKEFDIAYNESLRMALISLPITNYTYTPIKIEPTKSIETKQDFPKTDIQSNTTDYLIENLNNGFLIIDKKNNTILLKALKTSNTNIYIGQANEKKGVLYKNGNVYLFEYYENNVLKSETFDLKQ